MLKSLYSTTLRKPALIVALLWMIPHCPVASGQTVPMAGPVADNVQPPQAGIGHDYIHLLSETVNPANGTLSIRINFLVPKGRGLTPASYAAYNSGELNSLLANGNTLMWSTNAPSYLTQQSTGWGTVAGEPLMGSYSSWLWQFTPPTSAEDPNPPMLICNYLSGLSLTDLNGTQHTLEIGAGALPTGGGGSASASCPGGLANGGSGDDQVTGFLPTDTVVGSKGTPGTGILSGGFDVPVFAIDKDGNTYSFATNSGTGSVGVGVEDRNGNLFSINSHGGVDTTGRPLAMGGIAPSPIGTDNTVNIYGLNYKVTTTTTTVNYTPAMTLSIVNEGNNQVCPVAPNGTSLANSATIKVISSIALPNGQKYQFDYGDDNPDSTLNNPYGLISEIIYPDGGWVKYYWQLSTNAAGQAQYTHYSNFPGTAQVTAPSGQTPNPPSTSFNNLCDWYYQTPQISKRVVSYDGVHVAQTETFVYNTNWNNGTIGSWTAKTAQVTTTDNVLSKNFLTTYAYAPILTAPALPFSTGCADCLSSMEHTVQRYDWGSSVTTLDTATKAWYNTFELACEFHTNVNNKTSGHFYQYSHGLMVDDREYDFTSGPTAVQSCSNNLNLTLPTVAPVRETITALQAITSPVKPFHDSSDATPNQAFYKPSSVKVYFNGTQVAETDYRYDESTVAPVSGLYQYSASGQTFVVHDESTFGPTVQAGRGNLTSVHRRCIGSASCTDSYMYYTYDETGQVTSIKDSLGNVTAYSYTDNFTANNNTLTSSVGQTPTAQTNAYPTTITNAKNQSESFQYDWLQGDLIASTDLNGNKTQFFYDSADRLNQINYPDNGQTLINYNDGAYTPGGTIPNVTSQKLLETGIWLSNASVLDGMGHTVQTILYDPEGNVTSETVYDGEGHVYQQSSPHRAAADGISSSVYDALGRPLMQQHPDKNSLYWCYNGVASSGVNSGLCKSHIGGAGTTVMWVDSKDENGNQWQRSTDALGRLIQVEEPSAASKTPSLETDYAYDGLNNLLQVTQKGNGSTDTARTRTFNYNSLSQLVCASNPENSTAACPAANSGSYVTGTTGYVYDSNGNATTKTSPAVNSPTTASASQAISYCYDQLNRPLFKFYSSSFSCISPGSYAASYFYDSSSVPGALNTGGHLTDEKSYAGTSLVAERKPFIYDAMGRLLREQQFTYTSIGNGAPPYSPIFTYDLAGNLLTSTDGVTPTPTPGASLGVANCVGQSSSPASSPTLTFAYCYNTAGRLQGLASNWIDNAHPQLLFSAPPSTSQPSYAAFGGLANATLGVGQSSTGPALSRSFDNRLRVTGELDKATGATAGTSGSATVTITGQEQSQ